MTDSLAAIGSVFLAFLAAVGGLTRFAAQVLAAIFSPPYFPRLIARQVLYIGYYSLPVVGLTALFTGMVLALQSYTGFSRFNAQSAVATVVVLSMTRELGPVIASLMVAGRGGAAMAAGGGTMAGHRTDRRADQPVDRPAALSGLAAPDRRIGDNASAGAGGRHRRRVRRLS